MLYVRCFLFFAMLSFAAVSFAKPSCVASVNEAAGADVPAIDLPARDLRVALPVQRLVSALFKDIAPEKVVDNLVDQKERLPTFILEALGREYADGKILGKKDRKTMDEFVEVMERLEDVLGNYGDSIEFANQAKEIGAPKNWPAGAFDKMVSWIETDYQPELKKQFVGVLEKDGWVPYNPKALKLLAKVSRIIGDIDEKTDDAFLIDRMATYLEDDAKVRFDMTRLKKGIHPFRRHLRWVTLMMRATNGLVQRREVKGPVLDDPRIDWNDVAKYNSFPVTGKPGFVVYVDGYLIDNLAAAVYLDGLAKETGEFQEFYAMALRESGAAANKQQAKEMAAEFVKLRKHWVDPTKTANKIQNYFIEHKIREKVAKQLRAARP